MRKRELVMKLTEIVDEEFNIECERDSHANFNIKNHNILIKKAHELEGLGLFHTEINSLKSMHNVYDNFMKTLTFDYSNFNIYNNCIERLKFKSLGVIEASSVFLNEELDNTINFKLPQIEDLSNLSNCINDFNKALEGILFDDSIRQEIKLTGFDSGSMWIEVCVQTSKAISIIKNTVCAALDIKEKSIIQENIKKYIETINLNTENESAANTVKDSLDENIKILIDSEAQKILKLEDIEKHSHSNYNEIHKRMTMSINLLAKLFKQGAEIHGQLNRPLDDNENLFPDYKNKELIDSKITKLID